MKKCKSTQVFIFRTNKLQEIVGGFGIIRDLFSDFLFPAARDVEGVEEGFWLYADFNIAAWCREIV